jgi:hypothetical protein
MAVGEEAVATDRREAMVAGAQSELTLAMELAAAAETASLR